VPLFSYKSHVSIDRMHGIVRSQVVTDAARHDGGRLREGLIQRVNTAREVWADSAYRSAEIEARLAEHGMRSRIHRPGA
jgi:IS5 family transposase